MVGDFLFSVGFKLPAIVSVRVVSASVLPAIETALSPTDELGKLSLFEAEIEFAKTVLERCTSSGPVLVMMDEIFHSTNASDGLAASRVFLTKLYERTNVTSIISTHYRELAQSFSPNANAWAMDAREREDGMLKYSYRVVSGVSDKSSVMEILRERGL
jgi:DNA mismatch repair ATPase MutS